MNLVTLNQNLLYLIVYCKVNKILPCPLVEHIRTNSTKSVSMMFKDIVNSSTSLKNYQTFLQEGKNEVDTAEETQRWFAGKICYIALIDISVSFF